MNKSIKVGCWSSSSRTDEASQCQNLSFSFSLIRIGYVDGSALRCLPCFSERHLLIVAILFDVQCDVTVWGEDEALLTINHLEDLLVVNKLLAYWLNRSFKLRVVMFDDRLLRHRQVLTRILSIQWESLIKFVLLLKRCAYFFYRSSDRRRFACKLGQHDPFPWSRPSRETFWSSDSGSRAATPGSD